MKEIKSLITFFYKYNVFLILHLQIILIIFPLSAYSETLLQRETLSFDICLEVIKTTSEKLSIEPFIEDKEKMVKKASFKMSDGVLSIICDEKNNELKVVKE